ncbi:DNA (cytosine-5)-methyltransferase 1 isoform X2 [Capsicum annuum]|uniref:DNA (cytosine-5)-methyltransferase 1 isoform X2 n=1 Tax=Capsicum annuum TaxID=4072 RepID=UPI001FB1255D|nr:DNA (cytosine-5)-methyltransferase 1 isoform X2 [Capsicum annuum]
MTMTICVVQTDVPGVRVRPENKVEWDPDAERVPDYAMSFVGGNSSKPFGRLWCDETVLTVVTRYEPHNQTIIHPVQDRVLTIRENARLQGFPDYYELTGPIKERLVTEDTCFNVLTSSSLKALG